MTTRFSDYSDASSSYWPPGWNFARYASATENDPLSDGERAKMQAGFREVLGEAGVAEMARVVFQEQLRVMKAQTAKEEGPPPVPKPPLWLTIWRKRYQPQGQGWGFVGFWTAGTAAGTDIKGFQDRVRDIIEIPFDAAVEGGQAAQEIAEARRTFRIQWVRVDDEGALKTEEEDPSELLERLRARYRLMQESGTLLPGFSLPVFLVASPSAVTSVLSTPETGEDKPGPGSRRWRSGAPFVLVVSGEEEQGVVDDDPEAEALFGRSKERDWFKPVFRAAVEVLVDELWPVVVDQMMPLGRILRFVQGAEVTEEVLASGGPDEDDLDAIWWSVFTPPHHMRKRRNLFITST